MVMIWATISHEKLSHGKTDKTAKKRGGEVVLAPDSSPCPHLAKARTSAEANSRDDHGRIWQLLLAFLDVSGQITK